MPLINILELCYLTGIDELEERESHIRFGWVLEAERYAYFKHLGNPKILKKVGEFLESLTYTYRTLWIKILSSS